MLQTKKSLPSCLIVFFICFVLATTAGAQNRPKVGLVLSGGGARGLAHVGLLKMIDSLQIPVDFIAGTSMGALAGGLYAIGYSGKQIEQLVQTIDWNEMFTDTPRRQDLPFLQKVDDGRYQINLGLNGFIPTLPGGLIQGQKVSMLISRLIADKEVGNDFSKFPIPFKCVAIDLTSGREVVLENGSLARALRATMSLPTVFTPVTMGDSMLVDGGILNNFPADVCRAMGAGVIIGANVGTPLKKRKELNNLIGLMEQTMVLTDYARLQQNKALCDLVITPNLEGFSTGDFDEKSVHKILARGQKAARDIRPALIALQNKYNLYRADSLSSFHMGTHSKRLFGITVNGNQNMSVAKIVSLLGLKPGQHIDGSILDEAIGHLYTLGIFHYIYYELQPVRDDYYRLLITVNEKHLRNLRFGIHYDDYYHVVMNIGLQSTHPVFRGMRGDFNLQFGGLNKLAFMLSYPSRTFDRPAIPFLRVQLRDIPIDVYDVRSGKVVSNYSDHGTIAAAGLGLRVYHTGLLFGELAWEQTRIQSTLFGQDSTIFPSWEDNLYYFHGGLYLDWIDDALLPTRGLKVKIDYEAGLAALESDRTYHKLHAEGDLYIPLHRWHNLHLQGFYATYLDDLPLYKSAIRGGPDSFIGLQYDQFFGLDLIYGRLDYRYKLKRNIYLKVMANAGYGGGLNEFPRNAYQLLYGYGLGLKLMSIMGPFELMLTRGSRAYLDPDGQATRIYFRAGVTL